MATVNCAISGVIFRCDHLPITLHTKAGYYHPVFALPYKTLYSLYNKHCKDELTPTDSYLTFLAFLHSTDSVEWRAPSTLDPNSRKATHLIECNLKQLIEVIERTNCIQHPSFSQPRFVVDKDNSELCQIHNWIAAWQENIDYFLSGRKTQALQEELQKVENRLSYLLKSGVKPEQYSSTVANWADKVAEFPAQYREDWMRIIRSCFNTEKMFNTPLKTLKEIKNYCLENIEPGSIHFHALMQVLDEGISRHANYLGMGAEALGYTLLPVDSTKNEIEVAALIEKAPKEEPQKEDYPDSLSYLKARLQYRTATNAAKKL